MPMSYEDNSAIRLLHNEKRCEAKQFKVFMYFRKAVVGKLDQDTDQQDRL